MMTMIIEIIQRKSIVWQLIGKTLEFVSMKGALFLLFRHEGTKYTTMWNNYNGLVCFRIIFLMDSIALELKTRYHIIIISIYLFVYIYHLELGKGDWDLMDDHDMWWSFIGCFIFQIIELYDFALLLNCLTLGSNLRLRP